VVKISTGDMPTLLAAYDTYLCHERVNAASTRKRYIAILEEFANFLEKHFDAGTALEGVQKAHLTQFLRQGTKTTGEPSPAVWNLRLAALLSFYDYLFEDELINANPAKRIRWQESTPDEVVPLSWEEYLALLTAAENSSAHYRKRNIAIVQVFFHSMLRVSELTSLNIDMLDLEHHIFRDVRVKRGKKLSILFNNLVAGALEDYISERSSFRPKEGQLAVFLSDRGERISVRAVEELIATLAKRGGLTRRIHPHLMRHGGATELAELGTELSHVQRQLGHESIQTTEHYVHRRAVAARRLALEELGKEAAKRLRDYRRKQTTTREKRRRQNSA